MSRTFKFGQQAKWKRGMQDIPKHLLRTSKEIPTFKEKKARILNRVIEKDMKNQVREAYR